MGSVSALNDFADYLIVSMSFFMIFIILADVVAYVQFFVALPAEFKSITAYPYVGYGHVLMVQRVLHRLMKAFSDKITL